MVSITPTFQELVLDATASAARGSITITNQTDQIQEFEVFAVSLKQLDSQGNVALFNRPLRGGDDDIFTDIEIQEPTFSLYPNQQKAISFSIQNSINLSPGGHYASLVVRIGSPPLGAQSTQTIVPALSSSLLIRKMGGEQYNLSLHRMILIDQKLWSKLPTVTQLTFENQGNIHVIPRGQIRISDIFGRVVVEGTINEGSQFILPRTRRDIQVQLRQIRRSWPMMVYTVSTIGSFDSGGVFQQMGFGVYLSVWAVVVIGLIISMMVVWAVRVIAVRKQRSV